MKFTSTQENLSQGLSLVSHIAAKNTTLPILNNVLIKAEKGVITLATTNLEMGMYCTLRGKIDTEGSFTVASKLLADFVNLLETDTVEVSLVNDTVEINTENAHTSIKGVSPEDFPVIPIIASESTFTCKPKELIDGLSQVLFATAHSDIRPEITGVLLRFENGSLIMAATDSYRLAEKSIRCKGVETKQVIIPSRSLLEVSRVLSSLVASDVDAETEVEIAFLDNQVQFSYQNIQIISRLIDGVFPPYQGIIPASFSVTAIIPKSELAKAVKTASLFSRTGIFDVVVECKDNAVSISALNMQLGQSKTTIDASVTGSASIVLNHKYLLDGLNSIDSGSVVFTMNDENTPCLLRAAETLDGAQSIEKQDYLYIIMPIKQ